MPHTPPRAGLHQQMEPINSVYQLSQQNSTLDELFNCVSCLFQSACVMTIEGGHCKKPPMIRHFRDKHMRTFTTLPNIRTLIMRGAWNVIRSQPDFSGMAVALPNLREWHCTYSKPKAKAYMTVYSVLNYFPSTITHLNICLEGFYSKKVIATTKVQDLTKDHHLCEALGRIMPQLEALTLTGRLCGQLFAAAAESARHVRKPRLKSVDLVVKNCCRSAFGPTDSPGIHNWVFIQAFESLVTSATRTLSFFPDLSFLRIRFIDLDAPCPLLNPYFQLQGDECTGLWNDHILNFLALARPRAGFVDIGDGVAGRAVSKTFFNYPTQRPKGIKSTSYMAFADSNHF